MIEVNEAENQNKSTHITINTIIEGNQREACKVSRVGQRNAVKINGGSSGFSLLHVCMHMHLYIIIRVVVFLFCVKKKKNRCLSVRKFSFNYSSTFIFLFNFISFNNF